MLIINYCLVFFVRYEEKEEAEDKQNRDNEQQKAAQKRIYNLSHEHRRTIFNKRHFDKKGHFIEIYEEKQRKRNKSFVLHQSFMFR